MPITFTRVSLPNGWLGNMAPFPLCWDGETWPTPEALFQALRFISLAVREEIRQQKSPMTAKAVAQKYADKMVVEPTSQRDLDNMEFVLRLKLEQHPHLKASLVATGDEVIIEDVTTRTRPGRHLFWGMSQATGVWKGDNALGKIWMMLRDELRAALVTPAAEEKSE